MQYFTKRSDFVNFGIEDNFNSESIELYKEGCGKPKV